MTVRGRAPPSQFDDNFQMPVSDGSMTITMKLKNKSGLAKKTLGVCKIPMVEVAACGDEGLNKMCALLPEDYVTEAEPRGEVEVKIVWKHDRKYHRSMANLLGSLFSASPASAGSVKALEGDETKSDKTATKSMPPKEKKTVDPVRRAAAPHT